jgi:uncharacterized protein (DUF2141 family)
MAMSGLALGLLLMNCSKKIGPNQPELFPDLYVVSTNPAHGMTSVPDSVNISITFSEVVDTNFLSLVIAPIPTGFYSRLRLSSDGKTISSAVKLASNTVYSVVIFFALDRFRDDLKQPVVVRFATAASLPRGRISGKASAPFNTPQQGFVGLIRKNLQNVFNSDFPDRELQQNLTAVSAIANDAGEFKFENVPAGTYWPFAGKDLNFDGSFKLASGDQMQAYDSNKDEVPDSVVVGVDQQLSAIDLSLLVAGMKVVRTVPADGATNVPLNTNLEITFSAPVDTSVDFGLFAAPIPEGLSTRDLILGPDGKTLQVKANVNLRTNTAYTMLLYGVRSKSGQILPSPVQISFTTGSSFPTGEIRGTATLQGASGSIQNALVGLLNTDLPSVISQIFQGRDPTEVLRSALVGLSYVKDASGNFVISHVPAGTYWPAGAMDEDNDGSLEPTTGEPIGFFDANNDGAATRADSLTLAEGEKPAGVTMIFQRLF